LSGVRVLSIHLVDLDVVAAALVDLLLSAKVLHLQENRVSVDRLGQGVLVILALASSHVLVSSKSETLRDLFHLNDALLLDLLLLGLDEQELVLLLSVPFSVIQLKFLQVGFVALFGVEDVFFDLTELGLLLDCDLLLKIVTLSAVLHGKEIVLLLLLGQLLLGVALLVEESVIELLNFQLVFSLGALHGSFHVLFGLVLSLEVRKKGRGADFHVLDIHTLEPDTPALEQRLELTLDFTR